MQYLLIYYLFNNYQKTKSQHQKPPNAYHIPFLWTACLLSVPSARKTVFENKCSLSYHSKLSNYSAKTNIVLTSIKASVDQLILCKKQNLTINAPTSKS